MDELTMGLSAFKALVKGAIKGGKALAHQASKTHEFLDSDINRVAKKGIMPPAAMLSQEPRGFIFGKKHHYYVAKQESIDGHILVLGGPGSGKTSCIAIPSLLSWQNRVFAVDVKGELYRTTGNKRENIKVFNPLLQDTFGYDPFFLLQDSRNPTQDAREIALAIIPQSPHIPDPFWVLSAQNLLTGAILHYWGSQYSFVEAMVEIQRLSAGELIEAIAKSPIPEAQYCISKHKDLKSDVLAGIAMEVSNRVMIFATDPDIKQCMSKEETIKPIDLEKGFDIYLHIPEDKLEQWTCLLTLIINQFMRHFERRLDDVSEPVLFLLDEFPRLGKVDIVNGLATLRSKKITFCLVAQSLSQFDGLYGSANCQVIVDTCAYKVILSASSVQTQESFSKLVGKYEHMVESSSENFNTNRIVDAPAQTSITTKPEEKWIVKPEEFATLKDIVLLTPDGFMRVDKIPFSKNKDFAPFYVDPSSSAPVADISEDNVYAQLVNAWADQLSFPVADLRALLKKGVDQFVANYRRMFKSFSDRMAIEKMINHIPRDALADKDSFISYFLQHSPSNATSSFADSNYSTDGYALLVDRLTAGLNFPVRNAHELRRCGGNKFIIDFGKKFGRGKDWEYMVKIIDMIPETALADKTALTLYLIQHDPTN